MTLKDYIILATEIITLIGAILSVSFRISKVSNGVKCQLRSEMLQIYYRNCDSGIIRQYEYENFVTLYEAYKELNGNSFVDKIYEEVHKWKIIT